MRQTAALATLLVLTSGTGAFAATIDGCPDGTVGSPPDPIEGTYSYAYDEFKPLAGNTATCTQVTQTGQAAGTFAVYSADYRGIVAPGATGTLTIVENGQTTQLVVGDPDDFTDIEQTTYVGTTVDGKLISDISLATASLDAQAFSKLDTVDYLKLGWTSLDSVNASLDQLSTARTGIVTHLNSTAGLLNGSDQPSSTPDGLFALGAVGSHTIGVGGQVTLGDGLSLVGGVASVQQDVGDVGVQTLMFSGSLRYLGSDTSNGFRWFGRTGITAAPGMSLDFTRFYEDGSDDGATVTASTKGNMLTAFGEAGVLLEPDAQNSVALSGVIAQTWLGIDGYSETFGPDNLFPVSVDDTDGMFTTLKAKASWTTALSSDVDLTLSGAVGQTFADADYEANIAFIGTLPVAGTSEAFAELGARVGWAVNQSTRMDLFTTGSFGAESGSHVQAGASLKMQF